MKKIIIALIILPALLSAVDVNIMAGFKTSNILWDNPGKNLIGPQIEEGEDFIRGGSFNVAQPGLELRVDFVLNDDIVIPLGIDYSYFSAKELLPINEFIFGRLMHSSRLTGYYTGIYYNIKRFEILETRIYAGLEVRGTYISNISYKSHTIFKEMPQYNVYNDIETKKEVFRLGATAKFGIDAKFNEYVNFNPSLSYSVINLIGADNSRGELLTVGKQFESNESFVHMFHISLMLQYNF